MAPSTDLSGGRGRRLSDKLLAAFHQACDQRDLEVAEALTPILEQVLARRPPTGRDRRKNVESLVAAYERLWLLRHPEAAGDTAFGEDLRPPATSERDAPASRAPAVK